jgi:DEAD/DEAH box helicase domain-containing protein
MADYKIVGEVLAKRPARLSMSSKSPGNGPQNGKQAGKQAGDKTAGAKTVGGAMAGADAVGAETTAGQQALEDALSALRASRRVGNNIVRWHVLPAEPARYAPLPEGLDPVVAEALHARGIDRLYTHQAEAIAATLAGRNVVVVTPTASGKTLCYNVPVLQRLVERPQARALYLFPTKALAQDQYAGLHALTESMGRDVRVYTFDGDTPMAARQAIRQAGQIVVTNPDMLHAGILPNHAKWLRLFENLETVVIDELHNYRGVFGSHVANVIRRLKRICKFYGSNPRFICCSATVANPLQMAETLVGEPFDIVDKNGAPRGERVLIFYNPPVVNRELGIRASSVKEARRIALRFLERGIQTIVFARSRVDVEILTTYLRRALQRAGGDPSRVQGYRGGYLPSERREIERGVRDGRVLGVVSTNALELGIDIGALQAAVLCGYPGSIASTWQQGGRAGRKQQTAVMVLVATSSPLNQYLMEHPEYFIGASPEQGILNPDNLLVMQSHLKCALAEIPMADGETFGPATEALLEDLDSQRLARHSGGAWHWANEAYPAGEISLRVATPQNFIIHDSSDRNRVLGEMDYESAQELLHPQAIYLHQGTTYCVDELDWAGRKAYVRQVKADYYTDAVTQSELLVLHVDQTEPATAPPEQAQTPAISPANGPDGPAAAPSSLPPTSSFTSTSSLKSFSSLPPDPDARFQSLLSRNFGEVRVNATVPRFKKIMFETQESIGYGEVNLPPYELHTEAAWWTFRAETKAWLERQGLDLGAGLHGLAWLAGNVAPLFVMSDPRDLRCLAMARSPFDGLPAIYLYDRVPGGIGLARKAFGLDRQIFRAALEVASGCRCRDGCPSCVGPEMEPGTKPRTSALALLKALLIQNSE